MNISNNGSNKALESKSLKEFYESLKNVELKYTGLFGRRQVVDKNNKLEKRYNLHILMNKFDDLSNIDKTNLNTDITIKIRQRLFKLNSNANDKLRKAPLLNRILAVIRSIFDESVFISKKSVFKSIGKKLEKGPVRNQYLIDQFFDRNIPGRKAYGPVVEKPGSHLINGLKTSILEVMQNPTLENQIKLLDTAKDFLSMGKGESKRRNAAISNFILNLIDGSDRYVSNILASAFLRVGTGATWEEINSQNATSLCVRELRRDFVVEYNHKNVLGVPIGNRYDKWINRLVVKARIFCREFNLAGNLENCIIRSEQNQDITDKKSNKIDEIPKKIAGTEDRDTADKENHRMGETQKIDSIIENHPTDNAKSHTKSNTTIDESANITSQAKEEIEITAELQHIDLEDDDKYSLLDDEENVVIDDPEHPGTQIEVDKAGDVFYDGLDPDPELEVESEDNARDVIDHEEMIVVDNLEHPPAQIEIDQKNNGLNDHLKTELKGDSEQVDAQIGISEEGGVFFDSKLDRDEDGDAFFDIDSDSEQEELDIEKDEDGDVFFDVDSDSEQELNEKND